MTLSNVIHWLDLSTTSSTDLHSLQITSSYDTIGMAVMVIYAQALKILIKKAKRTLQDLAFAKLWKGRALWYFIWTDRMNNNFQFCTMHLVLNKFFTVSPKHSLLEALAENTCRILRISRWSGDVWWQQSGCPLHKAGNDEGGCWEAWMAPHQTPVAPNGRSSPRVTQRQP